MAKLIIKTLDISAKEWFDKVNGNSYFSAQITINYGMNPAKIIYLPFQYGYGENFRDMAFKKLQELGYITATERLSYWRAYQEQNIIARHTKQEKCLKRDVIAWGCE